MTETIVHVTTLSQWRNILDILFKQGYSWNSGSKEYEDIFFKDDDARYLRTWPDYTITCSSVPTYTTTAQLMEHYKFVTQQKEDNKMATYYVTQEQLDFIEKLKSKTYPAYNIINTGMKYLKITFGLDADGEKALLRYLGGDETVEFKLKEQSYLLWRMETNDRIYMRINEFGTPIWTVHKDNAFTAPLEEIEKWKTPAWEIEEVK